MGVRALVAAKVLRDAASHMDLGQEEDEHTVRGIHLEVEDAKVVRDVGRRQYSHQHEEAAGGSGMCEDMVAGDRMDDCSTPFVLAFLQVVQLQAGSADDEQCLKQCAEDLDGA